MDVFLKKVTAAVADHLRHAHVEVLSLVSIVFINKMHKIIYNIH